ncbi:MAG: isochorismate synthase [Bacteroidales bacterium]|nr:isochorismate synthase [Bacteroidales bacterium]
MKPFALYRMPGETLATRITAASATVVNSCHELNGRSGFVIAPFAPSQDEPILLIEPEEVSKFVPEIDNNEPFNVEATATDAHREQYGRTFRAFHHQLTSGTFRKIVLARQKAVTFSTEIDAIRLFNRACAMYPQQMIVLVSAEQCGTWLMATPEILLQGRGLLWRTMALAGTMKAENEGQGWSVKNIREQRLVSTYISRCLEKYAHDIDLRGPMTAHAGALVHLKSEFTFRLHDVEKVGSLLHELYPTPAVCGIPKEQTRAYICEIEPEPRSYYSGFMGPLNMEGNSDLYVSLRCMRLMDDRFVLYAGGGLISDSIEQQEWDETEAKMGTMLRCLDSKKY